MATGLVCNAQAEPSQGSSREGHGNLLGALTLSASHLKTLKMLIRQKVCWTHPCDKSGYKSSEEVCDMDFFSSSTQHWDSRAQNKPQECSHFIHRCIAPPWFVSFCEQASLVVDMHVAERKFNSSLCQTPHCESMPPRDTTSRHRCSVFIPL